MVQTECSETSAYKIQTPGNYPEENMQHTEHGESLKSSISTLTCMVWRVDRYKITFKLVISHWTNEMSFSTHSRVLFSSEYFHYKVFIHENCLEN
jgi:hypothetical protein